MVSAGRPSPTSPLRSHTPAPRAAATHKPLGRGRRRAPAAPPRPARAPARPAPPRARPLCASPPLLLAPFPPFFVSSRLLRVSTFCALPPCLPLPPPLSEFSEGERPCVRSMLDLARRAPQARGGESVPATGTRPRLRSRQTGPRRTTRGLRAGPDHPYRPVRRPLCGGESRGWWKDGWVRAPHPRAARADSARSYAGLASPAPK